MSRKSVRRFFSLFLVLAMVLTMLPVTSLVALATEGDDTVGGDNFGQNDTLDTLGGENTNLGEGDGNDEENPTEDNLQSDDESQEPVARRGNGLLGDPAPSQTFEVSLVVKVYVEGTGVIESYKNAILEKDYDLMDYDVPKSFTDTSEGKLYTLTGWVPATVTEGGIYRAQYSVSSVTVPTVTATFKNYDGQVLYTANVDSGTVPTYAGPPTVRPNEDTATFEFIGWSPALSEITTDTVFTAQYRETPRQYTVAWKYLVLADGEVSTTTTTKDYTYGSNLEVFEVPSPLSTANKTYTFDSWNPELSTTVTDNATYEAQYEVTSEEHQILWSWKELDDGGEVVDASKVQNLAYGAPLTAPEVTSMLQTKTQVWTFTGWNPALPESVSGDANYSAQYDISERKYSVIVHHKYADGSEYAPDEKWINEFVYDQEYTVVPFSDPNYTVITQGVADGKISGDVEVTFVYTTKAFKITWVTTEQKTDTEIETVTTSKEYGYGASLNGEFPAVAETLYTKDSIYSFVKWNPEVSTTVTGDATYTAVYEKTGPRKYDITWEWLVPDGEGSANDNYKRISLEYGDSVSEYAPEPSNFTIQDTAYTFTGWSPEMHDVTGGQIYVAQYDTSSDEPEPTQDFYTIMWTITVQKSDTELESRTIQKRLAYGASLEGMYPEVAQVLVTKDSVYTFVGWDPGVDNTVTGDKAYVATYQYAGIRNYQITWEDDSGNVIDTTWVPYGTTPTRANPTKRATAKYTYKFAGWTPKLVPVTGNAVYTAKFTATAISEEPQTPVRRTNETPQTTVVAGDSSYEELSMKMDRKFRVYFEELADSDSGGALIVESDCVLGVAYYDIYAYKLDEKDPIEPTRVENCDEIAVRFTELLGEDIDYGGCYCAFIVGRNLRGEEIGRTVIAFVAGPDSEFTNPARIPDDPLGKRITLSEDNTVQLHINLTVEDGDKPLIPDEYVPVLRFGSSNSNVAMVTGDGEITAFRKGTCIIQVFAKNGLILNEIWVVVR